MNEILLKGCSPTPLAHYLKALGILRIVAEQKDKHAKGAWCDDGFILKTTLTEDELCRFFLEEYQPSPILAPWNGRAGYLEEDDSGDSEREGAELLNSFRNSKSERFIEYRSIIETFDENSSIKKLNEVRNARKSKAKELEYKEKKLKQKITDDEKAQLNSLKKEEKKLKDNLIVFLRNEIPENQLQWLDALVALGVPYSEKDKKEKKDRFFSPLLGGAGGVEGSMDLGVNFMKNIKSLFLIGSENSISSTSQVLLSLSLFERHSISDLKCKPGALLPGKKAGPNSTTGFFASKADSNPWDFVLMIEGSILFITSMSRRMESSGPAELSFPFAFGETTAGTGKLCKNDEKNNNFEMWMPQWSRYCGLEELRHFIRDARVSLGRNICKDGLDVSRALTQLGASKGIDSFSRHAFITLPGGESLSITIGTVKVIHNPSSSLVNDLDRRKWLQRIRELGRVDGQTSVNTLVLNLENSIFKHTQSPSDYSIQKILISLGHICLQQANSPKIRKNCSFIPMLERGWLNSINNPSDAFRIACALASIGFEGSPSMRSHIFPIKDDEGWEIKTDGKSKLCTWTHAPFTTEICRMAERRLLLSRQGKIRFSPKGSSPVNEATIAAFLDNHEMDKSISDLLPGLCLVKKHVSLLGSGKDNYVRTPLIYRLLKPFFCDHSDLVEAGILPEDVQLYLEPEIISYLVSNQIERAVRTASRRLRIAGFKLPKSLPDSGIIDGKRLLTALMIPIYPQSLKSIASATFNIDNLKTDNSVKSIS